MFYKYSMTPEAKQFWSTLEHATKTTNSNLDIRMKHILTALGYANPISFSKITEKTIDEIENMLKKGLLFDAYNETDEGGSLKEVFYGPFQYDISRFFIFPGTRDLIIGLAQYVRENIEIF